MTAAEASAERRRLISKWGLDRRNEWHRRANPATDADEASLRVTAGLSPGVTDNPVVGPTVARAAREAAYTYAEPEQLISFLGFIYSNLAKRRMMPERGGGYSPQELQTYSEPEFLSPERVSAYETMLEQSVLGISGQIEVVMHDPNAPVNDGALVALPVTLNPFASVLPGDFDDNVHHLPDSAAQTVCSHDSADTAVLQFRGAKQIEGAGQHESVSDELDLDGVFDFGPMDFNDADVDGDAPSPIATVEPEYAWSVRRLVFWLMHWCASQCFFCSARGQSVRPNWGALVVGRAQRVHVFPICLRCMEKATSVYEDELLTRQLTILRNDGFHHAHGWFEDWWE